MRAKKLVLFISLVAIMVCMLALSASASTWLPIDESNYLKSEDNIEVGYELIYISNYYIGDGDEFTKSTLDEFVGFVYDLNGDSIVGYINIEWWHSFFESQNVVDAESMLSALALGVNLGYFDDLFYILPELYTDLFYSSYKSYVDCLQSGEYKDGYTEGYTAGYDIGYDEGLDDYTSTDKYINAIQAQYDKGLEDGSKNDAKGSMDLMSILTLIATLCTMFGFILLLNKNFKRKEFKK